ncbi:MAG TPA: sensor histidine kinase [Actinomycetota bacterium]|nr:sensor histidine kinase [Actinomycetota bacterium]
MERGKVFAWFVILGTGALMAWSISETSGPGPAISTYLFWIALLAAVELLPVSLGFGTEVTMAFPIYLALAILFRDQVWVAMTITAIGAADPREFTREIPLWRALFNRAHSVLTMAAAAAVLAAYGGDLFSFPAGTVAIGVAAVARLVLNFGLVVVMVHLDARKPLGEAIRALLPTPIPGFFISYVLLTGLGVVTAVAHVKIGAEAVAAILIPLFFARLSIVGARTQQDLSEKLSRQQDALLQATEKVFQERERERNRIAEDIHDSSLQMLAAAAYGCGNASELIDAGRTEQARATIANAREAIDGAIKELRASLVDLRRSTVEEGGLMETIENYVAHVSTLWGTEVRIEGGVAAEPPIPVSLAAVQILQEGLVNALKHAQGSTVVIRVEETDGFVHIVIEDDGTGFDPAASVDDGEHHGMRLMRERAERVGGRIELDTLPGRGTRVEAVLPGGVAR